MLGISFVKQPGLERYFSKKVIENIIIFFFVQEPPFSEEICLEKKSKLWVLGWKIKFEVFWKFIKSKKIYKIEKHVCKKVLSKTIYLFGEL